MTVKILVSIRFLFYNNIPYRTKRYREYWNQRIITIKSFFSMTWDLATIVTVLQSFSSLQRQWSSLLKDNGQSMLSTLVYEYK